MKRTVNVDAIYKTKDIHKNLARFAKKYPAAADYCEFDKECTVEQIIKALPITDKFWADGTINKEWTYYFDIDIDQDGMYIWFIERA